MTGIGSTRAALGRIAMTAMIVMAALAATEAAHARMSTRLSQPCVLNERPALFHPTRGVIIAGFGMRLNPLTGRTVLHPGVDYLVPAGRPVRSAGIGRVTQIGRRTPGDLFVVVDHGRGLQTRYSHLARTKVMPGVCVKAGAVLGVMGNRHPAQGRQRLHVEIRRDGIFIDPMRVFGRARTPAHP